MITKPVVLALALSFSIASGVGVAQDKITLRTGQEIDGEVKRFDRERQQVVVAERRGEVPFPLTSISSIELGPRPHLDEARGALAKGDGAARAVELLEPLVSNLIGLDDPLVAEAAGMLADAYSRVNQANKANQLFADIERLYPTSIYRWQGKVIQARSQFRGGAQDRALRTLAEVEGAMKHPAIPDPATMRIMGDLLMVRGEIYESMGKKAEALADYVKVVVIYYEPESRARQAAEAANRLRQADPSLFVN